MSGDSRMMRLYQYYTALSRTFRTNHQGATVALVQYYVLSDAGHYFFFLLQLETSLQSAS
jgi:hypothetical protein